MNILIGVHRLFYSFENINFKENYCVLNLEPLDEKIYQKESQDTIVRFSRYLNFLKKSNVIDYAYSNIKILNKFHSNNELFKFGFFNFNKNHLKTTHNNLYLFYGNCGDRRTKIFTKLINEDKLPINILHNIWGLYRDHEILNSRGIINIHRLDNVPLEIYRIWHSLCLGKKILSEQGADKKLDNDFSDYIFFTNDPKKITSNELKKIDSKQNYNNTSFKKNLSDLLKKVDIWFIWTFICTSELDCIRFAHVWDVCELVISPDNWDLIDLLILIHIVRLDGHSLHHNFRINDKDQNNWI